LPGDVRQQAFCVLQVPRELLVHDTADTVFARLTLGSCLAGSGDPCSDCQGGGPGVTECVAS
jgi:hypothetical protein